MAAAVTDRTRVVMVCTPNNPTGPAVTQTELDAFLAEVPAHVVAVVDEAYVEFVRMDDAVDGLATYRRHPNVVLFRTFSKAYGLAGFRVGYAVAAGPIAAALRAVSLPFGVSGVAQAAAIASLEAEPELLERVDALVAERARVAAGLRDAGWDVPEAQGNFFWFELGERTAEFAAAADERRDRGPPVRRRGLPGLGRRGRGQRPAARAGPRVRSVASLHGRGLRAPAQRCGDPAVHADGRDGQAVRGRALGEQPGSPPARGSATSAADSGAMFPAPGGRRR